MSDAPDKTERRGPTLGFSEFILSIGTNALEFLGHKDDDMVPSAADLAQAIGRARHVCVIGPDHDHVVAVVRDRRCKRARAVIPEPADKSVGDAAGGAVALDQGDLTYVVLQVHLHDTVAHPQFRLDRAGRRLVLDHADDAVPLAEVLRDAVCQHGQLPGCRLQLVEDQLRPDAAFARRIAPTRRTDPVRAILHAYLLIGNHDAAGLFGMAAAANAQVKVRRWDTKILENRIRHVAIVVLTRMNE